MLLVLGGHWIRSGRVAVALIAVSWLNIACTGESPQSPSASAPNPGVPAFATRQVDPRTVPTAVSIQQIGPEPTMAPGMHLEDNCVTGRLPSQPGTGQIFGQGVNVIIEVDTTFTFSRAVAEVAGVACRPNVGRTEVERLVATLNGFQGARVHDYSWPGR
jgi:hypothetical protein